MKAIFLDRDGVINQEVGYLHKSKDFKFIDGIFEACKYFQSLGFKDTSAVLEGIDQTRGSIVGAALISAQLRPTDLCESMWASEREYHIIIDTVIAFSKPQPFKRRLGLFPVAWNILSGDIQKELQHIKDAFVMRLFPKPKH